MKCTRRIKKTHFHQNDGYSIILGVFFSISFYFIMLFCYAAAFPAAVPAPAAVYSLIIHTQLSSTIQGYTFLSLYMYV